MKRNRSDSFTDTKEEEEEESHMERGTTTKGPETMTFLNHDITTEVARFLGVFGKDSSSFALVSQGCYQAVISLFEEWREYQRGFGLPRSVWVSESSLDDFFICNYRAAVVESLKRVVHGDRSHVLMEPELYADAVASKRTVLTHVAGQTEIRITLARTGHLRSAKYAALWEPVLDLLLKLKVSYLLLLPITCDSLVTTVGKSFLSYCNSLASVDLASLRAVTSIDDCFLCGCSSLTTVDLAGFCSVTSIGNSFLGSCSSLTSVHLLGLSSVTCIGSFFFRDCSSLTTVDLAGLSSVTVIGDYFLYGCRSLTSVHLPGLSSVTRDCFLGECPFRELAKMAKRVLLEQQIQVEDS